MFNENTSKLFVLSLAVITLTGSSIALPEEDAKRSTAELIASKGYPVVQYAVMTKDHYNISMQRIPGGRKGTRQWPKGGKPVAFLMTGLECSSADFVVNLPHQSLGFILADHGFDVWLGNVRGTQYSSHKWLSKENKAFWDFSIDEMAAYDLPAQLDWVLKTTQQSSLQYVGWSQGCAILFALLAERPEYNKKVQLFHAIAPAVLLGHMTSPMKRLEPISKQIYKAGQFVLGGSLLGKHLPFIDTMKQLACNPVIPSISCTAAFIFVNRGYPVDINMTRLPVYMGNTPSGTSMRNLLHYAQLTKTKRFQKFDWGAKKNWQVYKKLLPPRYNLKKVTAPVAIYWGDGDVFVAPRDVALLAKRLPNVVLNYKVPMHGFTHFDVVWSITAYKHLYKKILEMMMKYISSALAVPSAAELSNGDNSSMLFTNPNTLGMKKLYIQSLIFLCIAIIRYTESTVDKDAVKSTAQLIASQGYPVEEYDIMTEDWYIITVQRIPAGRGATAGGITKRKPVVFLMSGLEGCSADYVVNLPHQSLGFILADNGFDVWIGNVRGTKYSRHLFLERKERKFWNFCLDEMIRYDLPAQIDSILHHTGEAALHFVGWSQGGGIMFGFLADRPEYNKKVKLLHALAPAVFMGHMTAPVRALIKMSNPLLKIVDLLFGGTLTGRNEQLLNKVKLLSCRSVRPRGLCNASFILMNGGYPIDMNTTRLPVYLANDPAGTSVRNVLHLAQVTMANEFRKFDWGSLKNKRIYGQKRPPLYDMRKVTAPVAIYWGDGDRLTTPRDIARLIKSLPNVVFVYKVPVPGFTHLDFGWSTTAWQHLYKTIVNMIKLYTLK